MTANFRFSKTRQNWPFLAFLMNVNVARFARNVKWDFFCDFQTLCMCVIHAFLLHKIHWSVDSGLGPTPKAFSWKISSPSSKSRSATKYLKKVDFFYKCQLVIWKVTNLPIKDVDLMPNAEEYASSNFSCLNIRLFSISHAELFSSFESMFLQ